MQTVLYYPGFEVTNENWLKFALLYLDKLCPIVPSAGDAFFSPRFRSVIDSTDLIHPFRPEYNVAAKCTLDVVETCEKILRRPHLFDRVFNSSNIVEAWRYQPSHTYTVFRDKYTDAWEQFVLDNKLGQRTGEGITVSKQLGLVFMTILAQTISAVEEISPITDCAELDSFSIISQRMTNAETKSVKIARSIIRMTLPSNLSSISLQQIIAYRNKRGFKVRLHAFQQSVRDYIQSVEDGSVTSDFARSQGSLCKDFSDEIAKIGVGSGQVLFSIWFLLNSTYANDSKYIKELFAAGVLATTSVIAIRNAWNHTKPKRFTRKYLGDLQLLG